MVAGSRFSHQFAICAAAIHTSLRGPCGILRKNEFCLETAKQLESGGLGLSRGAHFEFILYFHSFRFSSNPCFVYDLLLSYQDDGLVCKAASTMSIQVPEGLLSLQDRQTSASRPPYII